MSEVESSGVLGDWSANALAWRLQVALFVNERSLLPVAVPLAPAGSVVARFPDAFAEVAVRIGIEVSAIGREVSAMQEHVLAKTANRRVLGVMNDFARWQRRMHGVVDLVDLSLWLAHVRCSPLAETFPDRAIRSLLG